MEKECIILHSDAHGDGRQLVTTSTGIKRYGTQDGALTKIRG